MAGDRGGRGGKSGGAMTAKLVNRTDGRWHIEIAPEDTKDGLGQFMVALSAQKLVARSLGGLVIVEVGEQNEKIK